MRIRVVRAALAATLAAGAVTLVSGKSTIVFAQSTWQVVAAGLNNPRGLGFSPNGVLYVAEAGTGGDGACVPSPEGGAACYGATGSITRITNPASHPEQERIVTGLPSLAPPPDAANAGQNALGPHDVDFHGNGNGYVTIGLGANPATRTTLGAVGSRLGRLVRLQSNGKVRFEEDLAGYEAAANPDGGLPDSNPFGVLALGGKVVYADAGANALNEVEANGTIKTLAVFPTRLVQNPFAPPGVMIPMQAVPTTVVRGPDGAYYVGQLTGFPFPAGGANVYRVPANGGAPQVFASGFTNIIGIAFGPDGSLYVLEITANGLLSGDPTGAVIRVAPNGTRTTIASTGLVTPGGIEVGRDGSIYVTNFSTQPGIGEVVRITP